MSHITARGAYEKLADRINKFPLGAPPSKTMYEIYSILFSEQEAELVAKLPIRPFSVETAAARWKMNMKEARVILDNLASRSVLLDVIRETGTVYVLPPPMAGFFEFSMMRIRDDVDQKLLGQLFYQYLNEEEDFIKELFNGQETKLGRVYANESVLTSEQQTSVLNFEKASDYIVNAEHMGISMCYCRHKMQHVGKACDAPMDICMTFGNVADSLIRHGQARRVDHVEGMELLHQAYENNLVQFGENVKNDVAFICNCCGCCCEALVAAKKFGNMHAVETTRFYAYVDEEACIDCGRCIKACPVDAIKQAEGAPEVDQELCLGCGVCLRNCHKNALHFGEREERIITPANSVHRVVSAAIEKGMLQNLIFDNDALASHRAMAAILSAILKLPPVKQTMASEQFKSKYLERLIERFS